MEYQDNGPGPFSTHLGFEFVHADDDGAEMRAVPDAQHLNGGGIVHGGYLAAFLDSTTGWAVFARMPAGVPAPHVQLTVQYLRAAMPGDELRCFARCLTAGRRIAAAEGEIRRGDTVIARAVTSHAVLG